MTLVLSLIGGNGEGSLSPTAVSEAVEAAEGIGARVVYARWLATGEAWEAHFEKLQAEPVLQAVRPAVEKHWVDVNVVSADAREKKLLIADMDSTIITVECIDEVAREIGVEEKVIKVTEHAMRGELEFEDALRERVSHFAGVDENVLQRTWETRVTITPGAETLVRTMNTRGAQTALISGGFTFFTQRVAEKLGFGENRANVLNVEGGKLAGTMAEPILGRAAKSEALQRLSEKLDILPSDTLAVGDGANDLEMINAAGLGVAFRAKPVVAEAAAARIDHGNLEALLFLQGIKRREFVLA